MLNRTVPTPANGWPGFTPDGLGSGAGGLAVASIRKTSSSGSEKRTALSQLRPRVSSQGLWPDAGLNFTTRPVSGPLVPPAVSGFGRPPGYETLQTRQGPATVLFAAAEASPRTT